MSELKELNNKIDKLLTGFGRFKIDIEKRFDDMEKGFEKRFDQLEDDIEGIYKKLEEHDKRFDKLDSRIDTVKKMAAENYIDISDLKSRAI